ncbi:protein kish-a [Anaeramoeba ignava]|uniref:Protein kish n=1 Tax=Anaeramoeba ignava TaxID=1746090 RepID=A0A9Q0LJW4_ANAIG|nr:protein kish-a [Anaeramoeba ignava]
MSALFHFNSMLIVILLTICSCAYLHQKFPNAFQYKEGFLGLLWKFARIGERLSPWVSLSCLFMGSAFLFSYLIQLFSFKQKQ